MVSGLNNWDRIESLKKEWQKKNPADFTGLLWAAEWQRIIKKKRALPGSIYHFKLNPLQWDFCCQDGAF